MPKDETKTERIFLTEKEQLVFRVTQLTLDKAYQPESGRFKLFEEQFSKLNMDVLRTLRNTLTGIATL